MTGWLLDTNILSELRRPKAEAGVVAFVSMQPLDLLHVSTVTFAEIPLNFRARCRWDAGKATDWSVRAVDRLMMAAGGRGIFLDNPIQRAWRDVHAIRAHAGNNLEKAALVFGRSEFGLPPLDLRF